MTGRCMLYGRCLSKCYPCDRWEAHLGSREVRYPPPRLFSYLRRNQQGIQKLSNTISLPSDSSRYAAYLIMMRSYHEDRRPRFGDVESTSWSTMNYQFASAYPRKSSLRDSPDFPEKDIDHDPPEEERQVVCAPSSAFGIAVVEAGLTDKCVRHCAQFFRTTLCRSFSHSSYRGFQFNCPMTRVLDPLSSVKMHRPALFNKSLL